MFSDDLAADVCGDWREAIIAGADAEETTRWLVSRHASGSGDDPQETVF
ncbi:MAG: hypothetical protein AVDCRST_MAG67-2206 [uncultured Solirubrobacteraceae bacterium]|uniref:Uncharacterized protein n=1 Tax=uncultured Solirubrobacteraceae bacterium TaxID=1162706 RepID=A0A6J4S1S9_9ACTN|nr:MAG: hypothetical protein AVDCRST_MAG67-2206 [uncultured Solirubrobacteraceae bacterium]